ncbi:hypothetical protein BT63DRAFT_45295 [Microthyrium microscopicum]|uniref:HMG box domain-containing protein n=1 Tax=Microthyrium microscopicum TaxID=703497 RepID=A0A6A6U103_9PEZI|nr:hypothetical protein BT63DRAFT_45295 [Microthyrium microscopicum]
MTDLSDRFARLGLTEYFPSFVTEGFDTWETVLDITESDLTYLNVKLGHRRKLQRAIAEYRGQPPDRALAPELSKSSIDPACRSDDSGTERKDSAPRVSNSSATGSGNPPVTTGTKRKYRRHPKPDTNAPERPPSAYVIFSNQIREELKGQELSFTEIAKVVGERWQVLSPQIRETCEQQANAAKERYYTELAEYKKTRAYASYQEYLLEFKAKHSVPRTADGKRSRLESEPSSIASYTTPTGEHQNSMLERPSSHQSAPSLSTGVTRSSGSSPPGANHSAFRRPTSSSPALRTEQLHSPRRADAYSPGAGTNPPAQEYRAIGIGRSNAADSWHRDTGVPASIPSTANHSGSHTGSQAPYQSRNTDTWQSRDVDIVQHGTQHTHNHFPALTRRQSRESISNPPPLVRAGSTLSSLESVTQPSIVPNLLPTIEGAKQIPTPTRTLPQPVVTMASRGPVNLVEGHTLPPLVAPIRDGHGQRAANWPALLRATELAREDLNDGEAD